MKLLKQESPTSRVVQKFSVFYGVFSHIVCRQRKKWWGWKITAWLYTFQYRELEDFIGHFDWYENYKIGRIGNKQF